MIIKTEIPIQIDANIPDFLTVFDRKIKKYDRIFSL